MAKHHQWALTKVKNNQGINRKCIEQVRGYLTSLRHCGAEVMVQILRSVALNLIPSWRFFSFYEICDCPSALSSYECKCLQATGATRIWSSSRPEQKQVVIVASCHGNRDNSGGHLCPKYN